MNPTTGFVALAIALTLLAGIALLTRRAPLSPVPRSEQERLAVWRQLHAAEGDPTANPLVAVFLRMTHAVAAPLARLGVNPDVLTLVGLWLAASAAVVAWQGGRWAFLAAAIIIVSSLTDGVDGAVAGFSGRSTPHGHVLDSVVDRMAEALFFAALVAAGGRAWAAVGAMGSVLLLEYTRARAQLVHPQTPITVGERPTRVIGVAVSLIGMGIAPTDASFIGTWGNVIVAAASFVGWVQLVLHIARWQRTDN